MYKRLARRHLIIAASCILSVFGVIHLVSDHFVQQKRWEFNYNVIIEPTLSDSWISSKRILVCVTSAAVYKEKRDVIRETWGSHPSLRITFFLGFDSLRQADVIAEAQEYGDIVQYDFQDTYRNLTLKTASMIHWAHGNRWSQRTHVVKIDDDVFLNTALFEEHRGDFEQPAIYGNIFEDFEPVRDPKNKWYLSFEEYYPSKFPTYLSGAFYILHEGIVADIFTHMCELRIIPVEDVYFTGLVADKANVKRIAFPEDARLLDVPEYNQDPLTAWFYGEVNLELSTVLAVHYVEPAVQRIYWNHILTDPETGRS